MEFIDVLIIIGIVVCLISVITGIKYLCKKHLKRHQQKKQLDIFQKGGSISRLFVAIPKKWRFLLYRIQQYNKISSIADFFLMKILTLY